VREKALQETPLLVRGVGVLLWSWRNVLRTKVRIGLLRQSQNERLNLGAGYRI
jgi:hypothetical protein